MVFFRKQQAELDVGVTYIVDQPYYDSFYQNWITYRSRRQRYALPATLTVAAAAIIAVIVAPEFRAISGGILVAAILYSIDAGTHRQRWLRQRKKSLSLGKEVSLHFNEETVQVTTANSEGRLNYRAFESSFATPNGLFLVPENGISIFVPKSAFCSEEEYDAVTKKLDESMSA